MRGIIYRNCTQVFSALLQSICRIRDRVTVALGNCTTLATTYLLAYRARFFLTEDYSNRPDNSSAFYGGCGSPADRESAI